MRTFSLSFIMLLFLFSACNAQTRARLSGTITTCETDEPMEGVCITCETADPIYTDVDGHYTLAITSGTYDITMEKEGFGIIDLPATNLCRYNNPRHLPASHSPTGNISSGMD